MNWKAMHPDERTKYLLLWQFDGYTYEEAAGMAGIPIQSIYSVCKYRGIKLKHSATFPQPKHQAEVLRMRQEGATLQAIADKLGVSRQRVGQILRRVRVNCKHEPTKTPLEEPTH